MTYVAPILLVLLILLLIAAWLSNLFGIPGNWIMIALLALWSWWQPPENAWDISWGTIAVFIALAGLGELLEFAASVLGTRKAGGGRRAAVLSVVGSILGGLAGALIGFPIPVIGWLIGTILFASLGAFVGAWIGEQWQGSEMQASLKVGGAAFIGRLVGTISKIAMGSAILVIALLSLFL